MSEDRDKFTCFTCGVAFYNADTQREHYKCDWHRYNLKRKITQLKPVSAEEFAKKVIAQKHALDNESASKSKYCESCRKNFTNENSYVNHLNSKKHQDALVNPKKGPERNSESSNASGKTNEIHMDISEDDDDDDESCEEVDSDEWEEEENNPVAIFHQCLFCTHRTRSLIRNVRHMTQQHSFFIPDVEYCCDLQGLLNYLGEKVYNGFMCLWCNDSGKAFYSCESAQQHMRDKGHCKMLHEGEALAEYSDFYDYTSSYPDQGPENEEVEVPEIDGSEYQLVLPSGVTIGHRSLMRYYKQHLNPTTAVVVSRNDRKLHKVLAHYKALGFTSEKTAIEKKIKDIRYMSRVQTQWKMKLEIRANKLQKHFRQQVNF